MRYRSVLLFGAPGSGKGTQGRVLGCIPGFYYFATGDAFRALKPEDPIARIFADYSSRGLLVPDEITVQLWSQHIVASTAQGRFNPEGDTLVLDGFPRNVAQAQLLQDKTEIKAVIHLTGPDSLLIERLQRRASIENRPDDASLAVIRKRLETYQTQTKPVLALYDSSLIHTVPCREKAIHVTRDILELLCNL